MNRRSLLAALAVLPLSSPLLAIRLPEPAPRYHWECVPYARAVSGIEIFGDAHTWWDKAAGHFARGRTPRPGAVLAFIPHGRMELGHVATVSAIIDKRTIRVSHANWSPINGRRGQVERDVTVVDASDAGDWSAVRVWFAPNQALGSTAWPVHGFIYPAGQAPSGKASPDREAAPRLDYARLADVEARRAPTGKPTGRLAYLGKVLGVPR